MLTWHEIVNDTVGDVPVIVTFCPLCHTALVFERTLDGTVHDFGVSGNLRFSDMVMYDRQTETWWQQATGQGIVGDLTGAKLEFVPSQLIGLDQFAEAYPEGIVLSRDTGHRRDYGRNPYVGYDTIDQQPFLFDGVTDGRMPPKERVVTLGEQDSESPISVPYSELRQVGAVNLDFEGQPIVALWTPGAISALDRAYIDESDGRGRHRRLLRGRRRPGADLRAATAARTHPSPTPRPAAPGTSPDGPSRDRWPAPSWSRSTHGDHFWFAWAAFVPHTDIWTTDGIIRLGREEADLMHDSPHSPPTESVWDYPRPPRVGALRPPGAGDRRRHRHRRQPRAPCGSSRRRIHRAGTCHPRTCAPTCCDPRPAHGVRVQG